MLTFPVEKVMWDASASQRTFKTFAFGRLLRLSLKNQIVLVSPRRRA